MQTSEAIFSIDETSTYDKLFDNYAMMDSGQMYVPKKTVFDLLARSAGLSADQRKIVGGEYQKFKSDSNLGPDRLRFRIILKAASALITSGNISGEIWWKNAWPPLSLRSPNADGRQYNSVFTNPTTPSSVQYSEITGNSPSRVSQSFQYQNQRNFNTMKPVSAREQVNPFADSSTTQNQTNTQQSSAPSNLQSATNRTPIELFEKQLNLVSKGQSIDLNLLAQLVVSLQGANEDKIPTAEIKPFIQPIKDALSHLHANPQFVRYYVTKYDKSNSKIIAKNDAFCLLQELLDPSHQPVEIAFFLNKKPQEEPRSIAPNPQESLYKAKIAEMEKSLADLQTKSRACLDEMVAQYNQLAVKESDIKKSVANLVSTCDMTTARALAIMDKHDNNSKQIAAVRSMADQCLRNIEMLDKKATEACASIADGPQLYQGLLDGTNKVDKIPVKISDQPLPQTGFSGKTEAEALNDDSIELDSQFDLIHQRQKGISSKGKALQASDDEDLFGPNSPPKIEQNLGKYITNDEDDDLFTNPTPQPPLQSNSYSANPPQNPQPENFTRTSSTISASSKPVPVSTQPVSAGPTSQNHGQHSPVSSPESNFEVVPSKPQSESSTVKPPSTKKIDKRDDSANMIDMPKKPDVNFLNQINDDMHNDADDDDDFF